MNGIKTITFEALRTWGLPMLFLGAFGWIILDKMFDAIVDLRDQVNQLETRVAGQCGPIAHPTKRPESQVPVE